MTAILDLMSHRCPTMQSRLRRGLKAFKASGEDTLIIKCIDPRFEDNLTQYLAMDGELSTLRLVESDKIELDGEQVKEWESGGHAVDPQDIEGIEYLQLALLKKID